MGLSFTGYEIDFWSVHKRFSELAKREREREFIYHQVNTYSSTNMTNGNVRWKAARVGKSPSKLATFNNIELKHNAKKEEVRVHVL